MEKDDIVKLRKFDGDRVRRLMHVCLNMISQCGGDPSD